ncbi:MAG: cyclic nucleotide-binding domain-containing protein [Bacteroidetes bacterium]|jgi:CRP-like cAMP-binding protein|nr:cyclic nucleotide-binding domain-containing protein [Bacteroidota bacterium]
MKTMTLAESLATVPFFEGMPQKYLDFISGCAHNVSFKKSEFLLFEGKSADAFYVIRHGQVALEVEAGNKTAVIQTVGEGQVVGWSWLVPPYTWHYDARAVTPVSALSFNAVCVRQKCEDDPAFGYEMFQHLTQLIVQRLMATRIQLIDVYQ